MKTLKLEKLAAAFGFAALAVLPAFAAEWTYYAKGATGNPTTVACISDGNWVLQVSSLDPETGTITFGAGAWTCGIKKGEGVLDLRGTLVTVDGVAYDKKAFLREACRKYDNLTEFHADGVTEIGAGMFLKCSNLETVSIAGTATSIPDPADSGQAGETGTFTQCAKLVSAVFNLPNLTYIGNRAFRKCNALKTVTFSTKSAVQVADYAFLEVSLSSVSIAGTAWTKASLDLLLATVSATTGDKTCTLYVDSTKGWNGTSDGNIDWTLGTLTDAEEAVKPEKCFGVYRDGSRKAWLVKSVASAPFRIIIR